MLVVKVDTYKFPSSNKDANAFIEYIKDKYEYGGSKVYCDVTDNIAVVSWEHVVDTSTDKEFKDFKNYINK